MCLIQSQFLFHLYSSRHCTHGSCWCFEFNRRSAHEYRKWKAPELIFCHGLPASSSLSQLKAFYVDFIVPLENNLEKDTKVVQHEQKKFVQLHKQRIESFNKGKDKIFWIVLNSLLQTFDFSNICNEKTPKEKEQCWEGT